MPKDLNIEKTFFWGMLFALLVAFFWLLIPFYSTLFFSLVLALACEPLYQLLLRTFKKRRRLAAASCLVIVILFLLIPAGFVFSLIVEQVLKVAQTFDPHWFDTVFAKVRLWLGTEVELAQWLKEALHNSAQYLYQFSPKVVSKTANVFLNGILTLIVTYFFLSEGPKLYHEILEISPLNESYEKTLGREIQQTLRACVYGQLLTALSQAVLAGFGFWILGLPGLLLGLVTFIMAFVPVLGTASVWVPVFFYLLATGSYGQATFLFFFGTLIISGIDNILKPILIQGQTQIHPVLLFLTIFGGLKLWGPIGLLAGPTIIAVLLATLKIYKRDFR